MYSLDTIKYLNEQETKTKGIKPKLIQDINDAFKISNSCNDIANITGFIELDCLFVDKIGIGADNEMALTISAYKAKINALLQEHKKIYGMITSEGQFQLYVTIYTKK